MHEESSVLQRNEQFTMRYSLGRNAYVQEQDGEQEVDAQQSQLGHVTCHGFRRDMARNTAGRGHRSKDGSYRIPTLDVRRA